MSDYGRDINGFCHSHIHAIHYNSHKVYGKFQLLLEILIRYRVCMCVFMCVFNKMVWK